MKHVVLFSGGIGSWAAAKRVAGHIDIMGGELILLFTDTKMEDEDLYRFIREAADNVGGELVVIADGRDVWQVFFDEGMIGNTRADICSRILKRDLARAWIEEHVDPLDSMLYMGIDWSELHRYERARPRWKPYDMRAPLTEPPYLTKPELIAWAAEEGLKPPRLYDMGFPHNNCGGFCVKQGHAAFANLLQQMPDRFAYHEAKEQEFRDRTGKHASILRDRTGGETKPFTLTEFRERAEKAGDQLTLDDWGGCGCMID